MSDLRCYGRAWESDDENCVNCPVSVDCRLMMRRSPTGGSTFIAKRQKTRIQQARLRKQQAERGVSLMGGPQNIQAVPRQPGEAGWVRFLKNLGYGAASRCGIEISLFFEDERIREDGGTIGGPEYDEYDDDPEDA